jgi:hypothetical protein
LKFTVGTYGTVTHFSLALGLLEVVSSLSSFSLSDLSFSSWALRFSSARAVSGAGQDIASSTGGGT